MLLSLRATLLIIERSCYDDDMRYAGAAYDDVFADCYADALLLMRADDDASAR